MAPNTAQKEDNEMRKGEKERGGLSFTSFLCGMTSLCTAAVFVNQGQGCLLDRFSGKERRERGGREVEKRSKGEKNKLESRDTEQ